MIIPADVGLFLVLLLPLLVAAGTMLWGHAAAAGARQHAVGLVLAIGMGTAILALLLSREGAVTSLTASQITLCALAVLAALIIAAPLLDRARHGGLALASIAGGILSVQLILNAQAWLPAIHRSGLLLTLVAIASFVALAGSALLPRHRARWTAQLRPRLPTLPQGWLLSGCALLALLLAGLGWLLEPAATPLEQLPLAMAGLTGGWVALFLTQRAHAPYPLFACGQGLVAGVLFALILTLTPTQGVLAGIAAALLVRRGTHLSRWMKLDDPANHLGMVLLPALTGLLLAGFYHWALAAVVLALVISLLWPLAMLLLGLRPASSQLHAGLDSGV